MSHPLQKCNVFHTVSLFLRVAPVEFPGMGFNNQPSRLAGSIRVKTLRGFQSIARPFFADHNLPVTPSAKSPHSSADSALSSFASASVPARALIFFTQYRALTLSFHSDLIRRPMGVPRGESIDVSGKEGQHPGSQRTRLAFIPVIFKPWRSDALRGLSRLWCRGRFGIASTARSGLQQTD